MRRFTSDEIAKLCLMARCGHHGNAIAKALGRTPQAIRVKCVELGIALRKPRPDRIVHVSLDKEAMDRLRAAASEKGTTPTRLIRQVIEAVAKDNIFDAVIDAP